MAAVPLCDRNPASSSIRPPKRLGCRPCDNPCTTSPISPPFILQAAAHSPPAPHSHAQILDRGERLDLLVERTDDLASSTFTFKREARRVHGALWWRSVRLRVCILALCALCLYVLLAVVCSPTLHC